MLNEPPSKKKKKKFQLISDHFKVNSSPPNIQQQTEHLSHEYKLDDETLQKAQLKQHKIFQNFLTSPAPAAPNAPPANRHNSKSLSFVGEELPRSVGAQYATGDQWRNNSRKNEGMEQSKNNTQLWM